MELSASAAVRCHFKVLCLRYFSISNDQGERDPLTWRLYLTQALNEMFGLLGTSIAVDILHTDANNLYIRTLSS